ncbi:Nup93/Nic96-domain-containing protein [Pseudomassariella vexata]|uniref:Nup93/Nic96-domain-containing protein n=1 Tax=Pseudomassariella vexata TaxID=1141098 RepID=A0A1Y2DXX7_9PEZI|nr:Nup93/Nic96-domain-containing protein [Pseudomassariella vexata]ORY64059.1 Nup93/Nic96-domain-containing protein [Pseudomassariella vexata]
MPTTMPASTGGGGLFGSLGGSTAPKPNGLFGATSTTTQAQPTTSILGGAAQPSLFGGQQTQTGGGLGLSTNKPGTSSLFGASALQQPNPNPATNGNAPNQGTTTGYFDSLLAKSKRQADGDTPLEDLPSLQLGLGDLRQKLRKLGPRAQDPLQSNRAQYMLAASGVDPGAAVRDLNFFDIQAGRHERPVPNAGTTEIDVETYLANLQAKTTLSMIADGLERSVRDFDNFLEDNITMEWEAQRKRIYEHFGIKGRDDGGDLGASMPGRESLGGFGRSRRTKNAKSAAPADRASTLGRSNLQKSVIGTPSKIGSHQSEFTDVEDKTGKSASVGGVSMDDRFMREKQGKLAEQVRELNKARLEQKPFPLLHKLGEVENQSGDRHAQHLVDAYHAVMAMVGENLEADTFARNATAKERQFTKFYLDLQSNSPNAVEMRKTILKGANQFLEQKFFQDAESLIRKHPQDANLGGRPDVVSKIKAYVRLRNIRKDLVPDNTFLQTDKPGSDTEYLWANVYYLLRSGHVAEAAEYVKTHATTFRNIDRSFPLYLLEYASSDERRLRRQLQERCNNEYNQRIRNASADAIDPFRMACYKIVGRCEVSNRNLDGLNSDINDWIWLQFNLARENDRLTEVAGESYTLSNLQETIREIGLKHFPKSPAEDTNGTFGMYFFLQILAGMFEQAVAYLYPFAYADAIHFAIALEYYGLLRASDPWSNPNELLSFNTRSQPQISFGRMLGYYTRDFRAADVASAVDYLALICLNADLDGETGRQQAELCHVALRELVLETREFSKLIGDIRPDGQRIAGLIEERGRLIGLRKEDDFVMAVTLQAARYADENGRTTDAVLLYHLAADYDSVVAIVSRALSEAIAIDIGHDPVRLQPVKPRAEGKQADAQLGSSLSLAAIDDPVDLARTMMSMYQKDAMFYSSVQEQNRIACHLLLQMSEIKGMVEAGQWPETLDKIGALDILPLDAKGDASKIRHCASKFSGLTQPVAINVPNLLMWTITCCVKQRERLMGGQYSGNEGTRRMMCDNLKQISMDLTTYTSQLKYRFPPHLHQALARASSD